MSQFQSRIYLTGRITREQVRKFDLGDWCQFINIRDIDNHHPLATPMLVYQAKKIFEKQPGLVFFNFDVFDFYYVEEGDYHFLPLKQQ